MKSDSPYYRIARMGGSQIVAVFTPIVADRFMFKAMAGLPAIITALKIVDCLGNVQDPFITLGVILGTTIIAPEDEYYVPMGMHIISVTLASGAIIMY